MRLWIDGKNENITFQEYLKVTRLALEKYHWKLDWESRAERQARIEQISPHEWQKQANCDSHNTVGILLIHGLLDSPFLMKDVGDALNKTSSRCVLIRSILLPGHGTNPGDLREVKWTDWLAAVNYGIESFYREVSVLHLVGFSTGGALAIYWAINPENIPLPVPIKSIILLSPAIHILGLPTIPKPLLDAVVWVRNSVDALAWQDKFADRDFAKYESFPLNAAYQLYLLDRKIDIAKKAKTLDIPVFMALSLQDATVDSQKSVDFFNALTGSENRLFLVTNIDEPFLKDLSEDKRAKLKNGQIPSQKIISFSHISFPIKPNNYHYGINGEYASCLHYSETPDKYCACETAQIRLATAGCVKSFNVTRNLVFGEISKEYLSEDFTLRRLSFNPYFDEMISDVDKFISSIE